MSPVARRPGRLAALALLCLALAGCGSGIERAELEDLVARTLEGEFDAPADVSCPDGGLAAEVDAATECTAVDPGTGEERTLRVRVASVDEDTAEFEIVPVG
ncbi:DUF4333 domain-containing protein [Geodermatophilus marinus]|uniref:DUF4333 domain-containing protein n=1 Tax=Geodermatophilus sp. LHW52908 TaxID=2303986 RepID=UPI001314112A|nr:DUF4333 domain-containing protein [Geodermatophilus sp. LHW52908]